MDAVFRNTAEQFKELIEDETLSDLIADHVAGTPGVVVLTTGAAGVANGADGSPKKVLTLADLIALAKAFDESKAKGERYLALDPTMYYELIADEGIIKHLSFAQTGVAKSGVVAEVMGIKILKRQTIGDDGATARYGFAFVSSSIVTARQDIQTYTDSKNVFKKGDLLNLRLAMGNKIGRADKAGVILVKQG
jgi:hypothetical protein